MKCVGYLKPLFAAALLGLTLTLASCGGSLASQIFNTQFLVDTSLQTGGAEQQVAPDLPQFLVLKATNQTTYPASVIITVKRAVKDEVFNVTLQPNQTVGKLIENCNSATNPVLSLFVPLLEDNSSIPVPIGQTFVLVAGLPVIIPASQLPGVLNVNQHFNCGDTVDFVMHSSFSDIDRYQISAVVYKGTQ